MIPFHLAVDRASELAAWLWTALMIVWLVLWAGMKRAKKLETPFEMLQHALPVVLGWAEREGGVSGARLIRAVAVAVDVATTLGLCSRAQM